ncbi:unnamed protein product [Brassica rapa subsp. narinosa]
MAKFDDCDFFMWVEELTLMLHQWFGRPESQASSIDESCIHRSIIRSQQTLHDNKVFDISPNTNASKKARIASLQEDA